MPDKEPQPRRLDIFLADIRLISACSDTTASRKLKECRDALGKPDHQVVTIKEYCTYFGYDYTEVLKMLQLI